MTEKGIKFTMLSFAISWVFWSVLGLLTYNNNMGNGSLLYWVLFILGGSGPLIASFMVNILGDKQGFRQFKMQFLKVKVNTLWYVYIFIIPMLYFSIPWITNTLLKNYATELYRSPIYMVFTVLPLSIVLGGSEEPGWRGVLLPELLKQFNKTKATLILGVVWALWHLPLFFIKGSPQENGSYIFFFVGAISISFLLTALYTWANSIALCILFHGFINSYPSILNIPVKNVFRESLLMLGFSILVFLILEKINCKRVKRSHTIQTDS